MRDSGTVKIIGEGVVVLKKGTYLMFPALGSIRTDATPGTQVFWGYISFFGNEGGDSWEHSSFLIPLPGTREQVNQMETKYCLVLGEEGGNFIRKGESIKIEGKTLSFDGIALTVSD